MSNNIDPFDYDEKHWGNLATIRGVKYYKLSHFEQKALGPIAYEGIKNVIPRTWATLPRWAIPFTVGALVWYYTDLYYKKSKRKDWRDYSNEVDPNPPPKMICTMVVEDVPYCERQDRRVPETREVERCVEAPPEVDEKAERWKKRLALYKKTGKDKDK